MNMKFSISPEVNPERDKKDNIRSREGYRRLHGGTQTIHEGN